MAGEGAGTQGLARGLAIDLKPLRVNCVQPGAVHTELFRDVPPERLAGVLRMFEGETVFGAVGAPGEVAEAYVYCMKDSFVTGATVRSDGGRLIGDSKEQIQFS
jgi:NAD(P)-dependent dehydrogenase (short-subunit alcohol dehydrogenase family)